MKLLGIVILYYPQDDVVTNINSYIGVLKELFVWDNTPCGCGIDFPKNEKIKRMGVNENVGIGNALNEAVKYAKANHFTHILTMDQDSYFINEDFKKYIETITQTNKKAIFVPNYLINGQALFNNQNSLIETEGSMTSGSVYPVDIFNEIGLFREDFFIDSIDDEFSFRSKKNGILTLAIPFVFLFHQAGYQKKKYKFLWKTFFPNEYSPIRSYYIIRNGLISRKLYNKPTQEFLFYFFYKRIIFIICYESNKWQKIKGLIIGYMHGKMGKTGKQTIFKETS